MFPPLPTKRARIYCKRIFDALENGRLQLVQVSTPSAERDGHGVMIGVLVCSDADGNKIILKAVSGNSLVPHEPDAQSDNRLSIKAQELWVQPIAAPVDIANALAPNDKRIHELTDELKAATEDCERRRISAERSALTTQSLANVHALYKFHTIDGKVLSLSQICGGKLPPTGTGDCCAPKLLDYAFSHGLHPVSMDEFFYGKPQSQVTPQKSAPPQESKNPQAAEHPVITSPQARAAQKVSGASYPPCDERCGIILPAMLGLEIIYRDDDIVVVNKQSGLLSVPGRGAEKQDCVVTRLQRIFPSCIAQPSVHRLDMETSGLMVLALNAVAQRNLSIQFQKSQVQKKYTALLDGSLGEATGESAPARGQTHGTMTLYFRLDIENRPHQIWDEVHGKKSITEWERLGFEWYHSPVANEASAIESTSISENRKVTRVLFTPHTGRTHQLRLAASDVHGFGVPIVGDMLYNERYKHLQTDKYEADFVPSERLCLHANYLSFTHPATGERVEFTSKVPF